MMQSVDTALTIAAALLCVLAVCARGLKTTSIEIVAIALMALGLTARASVLLHMYDVEFSYRGEIALLAGVALYWAARLVRNYCAGRLNRFVAVAFGGQRDRRGTERRGNSTCD